MVELEQRGAASLTELNRLFTAWVETVYHHAIHSETGEAPIDRFLAGGAPVLPTPQALREAFLWSERRLVTKTATVSLHGSVFEVDAQLVGQRVELVFDPFDLNQIEVRYQDRGMGMAVPHHIGRHSRHPLARPEAQTSRVPTTGIDYLGLVAARHAAATHRQIPYADLADLSTTNSEQKP